MYYAGTGESYDFELTLLALIVMFALAAIFSWSVPWFRNYLKLRREARLLISESSTAQEEDDTREESESWHSVPIR
jgi:hypothetical protein